MSGWKGRDHESAIVPGKRNIDAMERRSPTHPGKSTLTQHLPVGRSVDSNVQTQNAIVGQVTRGAPSAALVVDDGGIGKGQMLKAPFLDQLEREVVEIATRELGTTGTAVGCPYIVQVFAKYRAQPAAAAVRLIQRWSPDAHGAGTASILIASVRERVAAGVRAWRDSGTIPMDLAAADPALAAQAATAMATATTTHPRSLERLEAELGPGAQIDGDTAARLAPVVGQNVLDARVHIGPVAAAKAAEHGASAFAVGRNIVMGSGAPAAGTPAGDALLAHELAHTAQQKDAAADPIARRKPLGDEQQAAESAADKAVALANLGSSTGTNGDSLRTGLQLQRRAEPATPIKPMDTRRYKEIELKLKSLVAQKKGLVQGSGDGSMDRIDDEIDRLITELRVDFGVRVEKGQILDAAIAGKDLRVVDGRIVVTPDKAHYFGERMGFKLEIDHVPPGESLQIAWRWRTPASPKKYRFLIDNVTGDKVKADQFELSTFFWSMPPDAIVTSRGLEVVADIYIGDANQPTRSFTTNFIPLPDRKLGDIKVINAPKRILQGSALGLDIGPQVPDYSHHSIDWYVDGKLRQADAPHFRYEYATLGTRSVHATISRVRRNFGIQDKQLALQTAAAVFEVVTAEQYGEASIEEIERSPFRPKPTSLGDVVGSGGRTLGEIQHRITQGGPQAVYWRDRLKAQEERLAKIKELAPEHATAKPLPADPTKLDKGQTYSGPFTASLVMAEGKAGGGAQPLSMHVTVSESNGQYRVRLLDTTSKKVMKYDGVGATALAAYRDAFETWRTNNEYPTGGRVVHRFAPPGWTGAQSFSTTTAWKKAKDWVDGIIQVGGFIVGALLLASPEPLLTKALGAVLMAAVVARSSVAIYERLQSGGDALSSENVLDAIAIVTSFTGMGGSALRAAGLKAVNPTTYRVGNWLIMGAIVADAGTFVYASTEAVAALRVVQADPTLDDGQKAGELLRIMASLLVTGAMLLATNRDLLRGGLKPHDFIKSELKPGEKPKLDVGSRLDAEYELKKSGRWSKETSKLDDEELLHQVFANRSRQEIEAALTKRIGQASARTFADSLGNDAFVALHKELGDDALARLAKDVGLTKYKDLHDTMGAADAARLLKELGTASVKQLTDHLTGARIKQLVGDVGLKPLGKLTNGLGGDEIAALVKQHGKEVVKWAGDTLDGTQAKKLLGAIKSDSIKGMRDVPAAGAQKLVDVFGRDTIEGAIPPVTGKQLDVERRLLGETTAKGVAQEKLKHGKANELAKHANNLASASTSAPLAGDSLIVDTNVLSAIKELMSGMAWKDLQPHKKVAINRLRKSGKPPLTELTGDPAGRDMESIIGKGHDLRAANNTLGESAPMAGLDREGFGLTISRDSRQYIAVLDELAREPNPIGAKKGAGDRAIVADTLFARGPSKPKLMTGDHNMIKGLFEKYGPGKTAPIKQKHGQKAAEAISERYPDGFDVTIPDGASGARVIIIVPVAP